METKALDEYQDIDGMFYAKVVKLQKISERLETSIKRLHDVRQAYSRLHNFTNGETYNSHECVIKEMAVQKWIKRFETELKK